MIHNGCRVHTGNERVSTFQSWDPLILDLPSRFKTLPLCFVQGRVLRPKVFVVRCTRSHHQTENRTMGQPRLFLLRLTTCSSYPLLVNPTLNQLIGTRLQQACPHLLSFHTKNPRKRQTWSPQGEGHSVPGKLSEPPRTGQLHHTSAPREGSWTSAREHCCMFLPMTVDRNYYKWSIFVVFIELYLYVCVCAHTCPGPQGMWVSRESQSRCWQVWTTSDRLVPTLTQELGDLSPQLSDDLGTSTSSEEQWGDLDQQRLLALTLPEPLRKNWWEWAGRVLALSDDTDK